MEYELKDCIDSINTLVARYGVELDVFSWNKIQAVLVAKDCPCEVYNIWGSNSGDIVIDADCPVHSGLIEPDQG